MPLSDIILVLNSLDRSEDGWGREFRYVSAGNRVFAYVGGLRLQSFFLPVRRAGSGEVLGHQALLDVDDFDFLAERGSLPADGAEAAELDRRVCTLHALNYLLQPEQGILFLNAHPRTGADGGPVFAFEDILRPCGLLPKRVVLDFDRSEGAATRPPPGSPQPWLPPVTSGLCRC